MRSTRKLDMGLETGETYFYLRNGIFFNHKKIYEDPLPVARCI